MSNTEIEEYIELRNQIKKLEAKRKSIGKKILEEDPFLQSLEPDVYAELYNEFVCNPKKMNPTLSDIVNYIDINNKNVNAEEFFFHYDARGWELSKGVKMKNWVSAIGTWHLRANNTKSYQKKYNNYSKPKEEKTQEEYDSEAMLSTIANKYKR